MKPAFISLVLAVFSNAIAQAEPITLKLEWIELNSTHRGELAEQFDTLSIAASRDPRLTQLRESKHSRVLVTHEQQIEPGGTGKLSTQVDGTKFDLALDVSQVNHGLYEVGVETSLRANRSRLVDREVRVSTKIKLSHQNSFSLSGVLRREEDGAKLTVLIISLVEPWNKSLEPGPVEPLSTGRVAPESVSQPGPIPDPHKGLPRFSVQASLDGTNSRFE